jgi:hypothetical protein
LLLEDPLLKQSNNTQIPLLKQSVICDAETTFHTTVTRRSCYTGRNSRTLSQHQPSLLLETPLLKQSNRTQIPLLKQSVICDAEIVQTTVTRKDK